MKTTMGEKIKDMRVERHMTTKQLSKMDKSPKQPNINISMNTVFY